MSLQINPENEFMGYMKVNNEKEQFNYNIYNHLLQDKCVLLNSLRHIGFSSF